MQPRVQNAAARGSPPLPKLLSFLRPQGAPQLERMMPHPCRPPSEDRAGLGGQLGANTWNPALVSIGQPLPTPY